MHARALLVKHFYPLTSLSQQKAVIQNEPWLTNYLFLLALRRQEMNQT